MIQFSDDQEQISQFLETSLNKFRAEQQDPASMGIYCSPQSGWLTTNFNSIQTLAEANNNCPDFEFVEFDILELPAWQEEYESEEPVFKTANAELTLTADMGDEDLNEFIFNFLLLFAKDLRSRSGIPVLLQILDSKFAQVF